MVFHGGFTTLYLALTTFETFRLSGCSNILLSFKNIGIKLCQEKCTEHCKCLSVEYSIATLTCRLLDVEAKDAAEGFIVRHVLEPDASSLVPTGFRYSKACEKDRRCFETKSGKETCVKRNHYLGTEELKKQPAQKPTQESVRAGKKLLQAVKSGNRRTIQSILDSGLADINVKDSEGMTPILIAARKGNTRVFELLMHKGADMSAVDNFSLTLLHCAVNGGNLSILKLILRANKVDINRKSKLGVTPMEWARCRHKSEMVVLLKRYGGKLE